MATASTGIGPNAYVELCGHELVELAAGLWRSFAGIAFAMPAKGPPPSSATMLRGRCGPAAGQGSRYWPAHARTLRLLTQGGGAQDKTGRLFTKFVSRKLSAYEPRLAAPCGCPRLTIGKGIADEISALHGR